MNKKYTARCLLAIFGVLIAAQSVASVVQLSAGSLQGQRESGIYSFKGIPYAAAPVGDLRWAPPQRAPAWEGTRSALEYGDDCLQRPYPQGSPYYNPPRPMSEDCLSLNVWSADLDGSAPVMVWIHGVAFTRGSGSLPIYDGTELARKGIVLVTINYRLNLFGYLAHPELTEEQNGTSGNYGLLDQLAALEWVRDNIPAFGGNPSQVTVFGESAGSVAVHQVLASPRAAGLVHRAIGQSGGFMGKQPELAAAHQTGLTAQKTAGADSLAAMRERSAVELLALHTQLESAGGGVGPIVDGTVIPDQLMALYDRGEMLQVPVMLGYNRDETTAFALYPNFPGIYRSQAEFEAGLKEFMGVGAYPFIWAYPEEPGSDQPYMDFWRDFVFGWNMQTWAKRNEDSGQPSYMYFFTHAPGDETDQKLGAYHAAEIAYVFGNRVPDTSADQRVHKLLQAYWVNFASRATPNGEGLPRWPRFGEDSHYLNLNVQPFADIELDWLRMMLWTLANSIDS